MEKQNLQFRVGVIFECRNGGRAAAFSVPLFGISGREKWLSDLTLGARNAACYIV